MIAKMSNNMYYTIKSNIFKHIFYSPLDLESEIVKQVAGIQYAHPTILYVVRKVILILRMILIMMIIKHDNHDHDADANNKT